MSTASFSAEQEKIALEVLSKDKHAFYDILKVDKTAQDNEIKKSYRKLAIKLHPDKNPHPKASEAFKRINRAFEVLGDEKKRVLFDRIGRDPDDRSVPESSATASGFRGHNHGNMPSSFENMFFQRGRNPQEDLFDLFFNMQGSPFGNAFGGPFGDVRGFSFGPTPNGFRMYTNDTRRAAFNNARRAHQQRQQEQSEPQPLNSIELLKMALPIIVFLLIPFIEKFLFG
ncbi:hypothetical protein TBLA_0B09380 [Henningerozyma blattae CBS 6284]|uniref:J domain-containing protein n=1 Tax=Henningerozyma blattae (strain ATCC 34711 / CBS 6284 / DSM 70876 / NBRC 10599 / NRRL Y-10934 / UCD 77-7) TaxID=1071380 RepID=I2H053_HENB6|nr:hypothetical protein TBLA_0B09380 [Tetrapisispora blattae CBS 6284]CCH59755.1 hypothetical protein TBLA_0B09380 [Tetrapisispora blattae CBS 6284]